jgi:PAS domain S-box-containing protein
MNEAVLKKDKRYKTLAEVAPVGIFHTDATGYTTYVNPRWCRITGLSEEQGLGNNWLNAVHKDDKEKLIAGWQEAVTINQVSFSEYRFIRPDGSVAWVMGQAIPERDADNRILGYVGTITDITERKLIEEKEQLDKEFLNEMQLIANLGTYSVDIVRGMWSCSEVLANIFGIDAGYEKTSENWLAIVHPDWQAEISNYFIIEVIGNKKKFDKEYKIIRQHDKAERWVHGLGRLKFNSNNQPIVMVGTVQDITDRKQMEIELTIAKERAEESNSKFSSYVENAPDGVFVTDDTGNFLEVNPAASFITGYSKQELLTMSVTGLAAPDTVEETQGKFELLLLNGSLKNEARYIHKNGEMRYLSVEAVKLSESRIIGFVKDITRRKLADKEIIKSNERFELIAKATNDGLWDWELKTNKLWANEIHQQLYGLHLGDAVPDYKEWQQRIHPEDRERTVKAFEEAQLSDMQSHAEEYRFFTENRGWINVLGRTLIERNKDGMPVRLIGSMIDITEHEKAEEELLKSKQQFQNLVENISGVYWVNDLDLHQTLYISPYYETIWGRKSEDLYKNPADFINAVHPDDKEYLYEAYKSIAASTVTNISYRIIRPDGEVRWISAKTKVVTDKNGKKIEYGYAEDITSRKKAEQEIKNTNEQLRELTAHLQSIREEERKRIGREIHDELGQQLTAIKMDVVWIDKKIPAETTALKTKLKNINALLDGSNQAIRRILSELRPVILDDHGLIEAMEWLGRQFTATTGIPVKFTISKTAIKVPEPVSTCIFRVYQEAFTNITRHAKAKAVTASLKIINGNILLSIADDGKGFKPALVQNKKSFGIFGMKERVFSLNGKFDLVSAPAKGTKINITLPYTDCKNS